MIDLFHPRPGCWLPCVLSQFADRPQRVTLRAWLTDGVFIRRLHATLACKPANRAARHAARPPSRNLFIATSLQVGKYLVSPLTRPTHSGHYAAVVSIRSGFGSMTHDRVMRFEPVFDTPQQASRFATEQALDWLNQPTRNTARMAATHTE